MKNSASKRGGELECHLEWDPQFGHMCPLILTGTVGYPTRFGRGGVAGEAAGVAAEAAVSAGAGLLPTGTPGGKSKINFLRR